jgi:catechol 2,3-dioxygenase-like lactoylglutathione lyase family enzyme
MDAVAKGTFTVELEPDGLGPATDGIAGQQFEQGAVAFFDLQSGLRLALWPRAPFWGGYAGYFQDPDGHLREVVWNPDWQPDAADAAAPARRE